MDEKSGPITKASNAEHPAHTSEEAPSHSKQTPVVPIILVGIVILSAVGISAYYLGTKSKPNYGLQSINPSPNIKESPTPIPSYAPAQTYEQLFSGKLTRLSEDLQLFKQSGTDNANNTQILPTYYSAGVFQKGKFKGYTRIVALKDTQSPAGIYTYLFATKDSKKFILDPDYQLFNSQNIWDDIDKSKVSSVEELDSEQSKEIELDANFTLYRGKIENTTIQTNKKDSNGNPIYEGVIKTDYSNYSTLPTNQKVTVLAQQLKPNDLSNYSSEDKVFGEIRNKYLLSITELSILDSTGLPYSYGVSTHDMIAKYRLDKAAYDTAIANNDYAHAVYANPPHLRLTQEQITTDKSKFKTYDKAFPGACGFDSYTYTLSIPNEDVQSFGKSGSIDLFTLKDANHPLNKLAYEDKVIAKTRMTNERPEYSYEDYIAKNPLLFFKDSWGRWVVLGEYDVQLAGGCGKPVLYLYPTKPTKVRISFNTPMQITTAIPSYHNVWNVLAQPNGLLTDLQPQYTGCATIDFTKKGSEYAKQACKNNEYPYIYWAGNSLGSNYPSIEKGWYVSKQELSSFMSNKLEEMGLTAKEKQDMEEYWLPEMLDRNAPYYRISFLQTREMNTMIPMNIQPVPQTFFRVFLDYLPLSTKPNSEIQSQNLEKITRNGFTVVEWGGLKR